MPWTLALVYRLIVFIALISLPEATAPQPKEYVIGQFPAEVIKAAQARYIRIALTTDSGEIKVEGTAVRVSKTLAMSNFHVLRRGFETLEMTEPNKGVKIVLATPPDTLNDLIIFKTSAPGPNEPIRFAHSVQIGERVANFSNVNAKNGFFKVYNVGQITDTYISLDRPTFPGESGSGVFNNEGDLVGIIDAYEYYQDPDDKEKKQIPNVGRVISYKVIEAYIEASIPKPRKRASVIPDRLPPAKSK